MSYTFCLGLWYTCSGGRQLPCKKSDYPETTMRKKPHISVVVNSPSCAPSKQLTSNARHVSISSLTSHLIQRSDDFSPSNHLTASLQLSSCWQCHLYYSKIKFLKLFLTSLFPLHLTLVSYHILLRLEISKRHK